MNHLRQKILITELHDGVIENVVLRAHYLLGYEVLLFCKTNKQIKLSKYRCNNYSTLKNYDFSIFFHRKAEWSEKLYETVFSNIEVNIEDSIESIKFRILIKDVLQRFLGGFDELMYLAELKEHEYTNVKIRCRWNPVRSQILKKSIATNTVTVSFSFLPSVFEHIKKTISPGTLKRFINLAKLKLKPKPLLHKKNSKVIFFPHKGVAYGDSFEKDYYYSDVASSPLNRNSILHLEYVAFDSSIAKSYIDKNLEFGFIKKPRALDLIKYLIFSPDFKVNKVIQHIIRKELSGMSTLLFVYINVMADFLVEFYVKKLSSVTGCEFALLGYDVLFPKEISVALHKLNIKTIAIQERYTLPHAGNYNVIVDNYLVWGCHVEKMIDDSIGESFVGTYIVTGPPRSDKINMHRLKFIKNSRKKFIVYSNSPEPNAYIDKHTLLNSWVNIHTLLTDVLELANKYFECDFVIRAKHSGWDKIDYFESILEALNQKKNIEIVSDYDSMDISYTLLSDVHAIIGHHTSIADEGLCCGIPALFHDFGPYAGSIYAKNYNYNELKIFSESSDDFQLKFFIYFVEDRYPIGATSYMESSYKKICDGNVVDRINKTIDKIIDTNSYNE